VQDFTKEGDLNVCDFMRQRLELPVNAPRLEFDAAVERVVSAINTINREFGGQCREFNAARDAFYFGVKTLQYNGIADRFLTDPDNDPGESMKLIVREVPTTLSSIEGLRSDGTPFQQVLLYVLDQLYERGYRHVGEALYEEVTTKEGHGTHAYCEVKDMNGKPMDVRAFVLDVCSKEKAPEMFMLLTSSKNDNINQVAQYVKVCRDRECPELIPNREVIAFRNGLYFTGQDMVYLYKDKARWPQQAEEEYERRSERLFTIEMKDGSKHDMTVNESPVFDKPRAPRRSDVAMKYHDCDLPEERYDMPMCISTPEIEQILDSQNLDDDTKYWLYAFLGRCLHEVGKNGKDQWQVIPFIKGVAGCGKSTLLSLLKKIFPAHLVAAMSANAEEKFGWSAACDMYLWMCSEVRHKCSWAQGEFQSIVSAEDVPVAAKYKNPRTVAWSTPGILAGNEVFDLSDAAGSIRRRIVVWECNNPVPPDASDPQLGAKAEANLGAFVLKINRMYMMLAFLNGHRDIWTKGVLPPTLHSFKDKMKYQIDPLAHFMHDRKNQRIDDFWSAFCRAKQQYLAGEIREKPSLHELSKGFLMKFSDFAERYQTFRKQQGHKEMPIGSTDPYKLVFSESRFMLLRENAREDAGRNGNLIVGTYLMGLKAC
jgi:hypothetical protein